MSYNADSQNVNRKSRRDNWPIDEMRRLREVGVSYKDIARLFDCSHSSAYRLINYGANSKPRIKETPMQRAFRRFPIDKHKPCYD